MHGTPKLKIRLLRQRAALSQRGLATRAGIDHCTVSDIETGKRTPQPKTLRAIAEALDIDPEELWMTQDEETGKVPVTIPPTRTASVAQIAAGLGIRGLGRGVRR